MGMDKLVNVKPQNWTHAKWPLPRPGVIRKHAAFTDKLDRSYMKVGPSDAIALGLKKGYKWWWYALPNANVRVVPNVKDKVHGPFRTYTICRIGRMTDPKHGIGVIAFR